jgi:hypothetical protein
MAEMAGSNAERTPAFAPAHLALTSNHNVELFQDCTELQSRLGCRLTMVQTPLTLSNKSATSDEWCRAIGRTFYAGEVAIHACPSLVGWTLIPDRELNTAF